MNWEEFFAVGVREKAGSVPGKTRTESLLKKVNVIDNVSKCILFFFTFETDHEEDYQVETKTQHNNNKIKTTVKSKQTFFPLKPLYQPFLFVFVLFCLFVFVFETLSRPWWYRYRCTNHQNKFVVHVGLLQKQERLGLLLEFNSKLKEEMNKKEKWAISV